MRIKKLELCGFKSFKDRTIIHFDAGITGIVGPNGCGKSNIVDALVWVMGEQSAKHLRGSAMKDVIFGGAEGYAPGGMAEVSLTLENDGGAFPTKYMSHSEIMITRKLHRSGESEYLINREPARLKDIHEVFMDTGAGSKGFSIIEQGAIGKIITAKPLERRTLIEEAAGITKFKVRKRESERKLHSTEQNLLRLNDIVSELKRQIDNLERQARKAERYRSLKEKVEDLDLWLSSRKYLELKQTADEAQALYDELRHTEEDRTQSLESMEASFEEKREGISTLESTYNQEQESVASLTETLQEKRMELQNLQFEVEQTRRKDEMTGNLLAEMKARKDLLTNDIANLESSLSSAREEAMSLQSSFESQNESYQEKTRSIIEKEEEMTNARRKMVASSQALSSIEGSYQAYLQQREDSKNILAEANQILDDLKVKMSEFEKIAMKRRSELEESKQMSLDILNDVETFSQNKDVLLEKVKEKRVEVESYKDELNQVTSRLYGLENLHANFEGFQEGVKSVMMWQKKRVEHADGRVSEVQDLKPMSDVVSIPEEYELAMEAALGNRLQLLLSDSGGQSLEAVDYLKTEKNGRSSFFSMEEAERQPVFGAEPPKEQAVLLKDIVSSPEKYKKAVSYMIGKVAVVENIRSALALRSDFSDWTFVTKDGDTLSSDGVLTGGTAESAGSGILKRGREIKDLIQKKSECAGKLALSSQSLKKMEAQLNNMEEELEKVQKTQAEFEIRMAELRKDNERADNEMNNAKLAVDKQIGEVSRLDKQAQDLILKIDEMEKKKEELSNESLSYEQRSEELKLEIENLRLGIEELQQNTTSAKVASAEKRQEAEGLERQMQMLQTSLNEVLEKLSTMNEESEQNQSSLNENQVLLESEKIVLEKLAQDVQIKKESLSVHKEAYETAYSEVRNLEDELNKLRRQNNEQMTSMNESQLKAEQSKMKEDYLVEQIRERYMVELSDVAESYKEREGDVKAASQELDELKGKLNRMGEVQLSSIHEYEETVQRYEFLSQQQEDLLSAKKELQKVIDRINRICSRRFKETFEAVNERFKKAFPVLFGGGEANLTLIEDDEKDEMGIDIMARPPGKKLQSVSLLSGGEKALTAVALIFSIFLVKPSPYCLLDEVDAPLDDANVMRFNDLVKEMAKRSQIIVVTHNKYTMEINKKLYGVTMQERGVSKMVSVSLEDATKIAEA